MLGPALPSLSEGSDPPCVGDEERLLIERTDGLRLAPSSCRSLSPDDDEQAYALIRGRLQTFRRTHSTSPVSITTAQGPHETRKSFNHGVGD